MKKNLIYLLFICLSFAGCEDEETEYDLGTVFDVSDVEVIIADTGEGTDNTIITSNVPWTISGSSDWCTVEPMSGEAGTTRVYFTATDNTDTSDRNVQYTLNVGGEKMLITVIQKKKDALTLSKDKFDFEQKGGTFTLKVDANVEFFVNIPEDSKSWITQQAAGKAMETSDLVFNVAANENGEAREGLVIIEDEIKKLSDTVKIFQAQKDMFVLSAHECQVPLEGMDVNVDIRFNVEYELQILDDWIHEKANSKAFRSDVIYLTVDETNTRREGQVVVKEKGGDLADTIKIVQLDKKIVIITSDTEEKVPQAGGQVRLNIQTNITDFSVDIPARATWISEAPASKAIPTHTLVLNIAENPAGQIDRWAKIIVRGKDVDGETEVSDTVVITQEGRELQDVKFVLFQISDALNGYNWSALYSDWNTDAPLSEWYGVEVDDAGNVIGLTLTANTLAGEIPEEIGDLIYLEELTITSSKNLTGEIPKTIGNLRNLKSLSLSGQLTSIPDEIWQLENLEELTLKTIAENEPAAIGELTNLTTLTLECNYVGPMPESFGNLRKLTKMTLGSSSSTGTKNSFTTLASSFGNLTELTSLSIYGGLKDGLPESFGNLSKLTSLTIKESQLSALPNTIGGLKALKTAYLESNEIASIPAEIGGLTACTTLRLSDNKLTGSIPAEIGNLTALTTLDLGVYAMSPKNKNQLTGSIPETIGNLTKLTALRLDNNKLSGSIPATIGQMTALSTLELKNNELSGNIPGEIFTNGKLSSLDLSNNQLIGELPEELTSCTTLKDLVLSNNQLSGNLPQNWSAMAISNMDLENNNITGSIPESLYVEDGKTTGNFKSSTSKLILNGNRLEGAIPNAILIRLGQGDRKNWKIVDQQEGYGFSNWNY